MRDKPAISKNNNNHQHAKKPSIADFVCPPSVSYVVPSLFLGDKHIAADRSELQKLKVTHIVNCAKDLPDCFAPASSEIRSPFAGDDDDCEGDGGCHFRVSNQGDNPSISCPPPSSRTATTTTLVVADHDHRQEWSPVAYHRCELVDSSRSQANFEAALDCVFAFIDEAMAGSSGQGGFGAVLIHCCAGRSRAPAVMTAYLMHRYRWPLNKAYALVCEARPIVCPNKGFLQALLRFEKQLHGTNSMRLRHNGHYHALVSL